MKVKELIKELEKFDPELWVLFENDAYVGVDGVSRGVNELDGAVILWSIIDDDSTADSTQNDDTYQGEIFNR